MKKLNVKWNDYDSMLSIWGAYESMAVAVYGKMKKKRKQWQ